MDESMLSRLVSAAGTSFGPVGPLASALMSLREPSGERYQLWPERLLRSAATLPRDVAAGRVGAGPGTLGLRREDYTDEPEAPQPSAPLVERAQDTAGVMGTGPLAMRPGAASLGAGPVTRRGLFEMFREKPTAEAPRPPEFDVQPRPQLPAVVEQPNLPAVVEQPNLAARLEQVANPEVDRRTLLRGAASVAVNASRLGKVAESLTAIPMVPPLTLPKGYQVVKEALGDWGVIDRHGNPVWNSTGPTREAAVWNANYSMKEQTDIGPYSGTGPEWKTFTPKEVRSSVEQDLLRHEPGESPKDFQKRVGQMTETILAERKHVERLDLSQHTPPSSLGRERLTEIAEERAWDRVPEHLQKTDWETRHAWVKQQAEKTVNEWLVKSNKKGGFTLRSDTGQPGAAVAALRHAAPFYSTLERAVEAARLQKGTPEQWAGYLRNQPGVKAEELGRLGLDEMGAGPLTREQVLERAHEGGVKLGEVWKNRDEGVGSDLAGIRNTIREEFWQSPQGQRAQRQGRIDDAWDEYMSSDEGLRRYDDLVNKASGASATKFHGYQLPGGENYRELLVTLPKTTLKTEAEVRAAGRSAHTDINGDVTTDYSSSHWDEPNVLGHLRMNDRYITNPEFTAGKSDQPALKSLHLEELQSDWHQAGRKRGYQEEVPVETRRQLEAERERLSQEVVDVQDEFKNYTGVNPAHSDPRWIQKMDRITEINSRLQEGTGHVPDAPFKATWPDLLLKRAVREAAENGYDAVSWTPGEAQVARYDLSKQVDKIQYRPDSGRLLAIKDGKNVLQQEVPKEKLADFIGKDAADKILNKPTHMFDIPLESGGSQKAHELSGLDLKVGGEGMRAFYDKMLVDKANALGKRYGARVEWRELPVNFNKQGDFEVNSVPVLRVTPQLRHAAVSEGFPLFAGGAPVGAPADHLHPALAGHRVVPVNHDPWAAGVEAARRLVPVDHDPWATNRAEQLRRVAQ